MSKKLAVLGVTLVAFSCMVWAAPKAPKPAKAGKAWIGVVSDSHCGAEHSKPSEKAATCVAKCVQGGSKYVLVRGTKVYPLEPQDKFSEFAGKRVKVSGTMSGGTITATDVKALPLHKKAGAKAKASTGK